MSKYLLLIFFSLTSLFAQTKHGFYFENKYEIISETNVSEIKNESNNVIFPENIVPQAKINIKVLQNTKTNNTKTKNKSIEKNWNPLQGFFKYKAEILPEEEGLINRDYTMKSDTYYLLSVIVKEENLVDFDFVEIKDKNNISSYIHNNKNLVLKMDASNQSIYILNKKHTLKYNDKFIIKLHNKKIELKTGNGKNELFE